MDYCMSCLKNLFPRHIYDNMIAEVIKSKPLKETKPDPGIAPEQIWEDKDKRRPDRRLIIKALEGNYIICETVFGKKTKIGAKRFREGRFRLVV